MKRLVLSSCFIVGFALTGCSSGLDTAKDEMTQACLANASGRLTDAECDCMTDKAFASLTDGESNLMAQISATDKDISESDLADELGMDIPDMRSEVRSVQSKIMSNAVRYASECVG